MQDRSVTQWIRGLRGGDEEAAARIWERFFGRVCALARKRLGDSPLVAVDAEDVALSAMRALCMGAREDRFRRLEDRGDLWDVLAMLTVRRAIDARRRAGRTDPPAAWTDVELAGRGGPTSLPAMVDERYIEELCATSREMLERLEPKLRAVALLRLEGYSNDEIAARTERSRPTVERHLRMIRHAWSE